jgi:cell division protein FtsN
MEKQKIFWVVLSVSVFVVVVLVVGVLLLRQKPPGAVATAPGTVTPLTDSGTQIYEYQREAAPQQPGTTGQKPGDTQTMHFYIGEGQGTPAAGQGTQPPAAAPTTATPPEAASPSAVEKPAAAQSTPSTAPQQKAASVKTAVRQKPAQKAVGYWIQTGSYKSQDKAEELATLLGGKGLSGRVFSYAAKGETFYRVRIGPYGNRDEAGKFLSIVKQIQGLEASYISQAKVTQALN